MLASFLVTHILAQSLFTKQVQSQRTLIISQNCSNATGRMQNNSSQYTRRTPQHHQIPSPLLLRCWAASSQRLRLMNSRQLVGLKFIDRTAASPSAFLPGSHCPERSEHMLLSSAACLTAKGWFNYSNCLMTEERAAGPCMVVCDKRETLLHVGLHYASLTVT